jgi:phage shock protein PspC (stress-responsive transcriptional regulator)
MRKLHRSVHQRVIAGVCGGLAESFGWDVNVVRILFVVGSFVPIIPGFLVYLVLWIFLPRGD